MISTASLRLHADDHCLLRLSADISLGFGWTGVGDRTGFHYTVVCL
jgi:hypothetical protein